jgi:hypothetical protein
MKIGEKHKFKKLKNFLKHGSFCSPMVSLPYRAWGYRKVREFPDRREVSDHPPLVAG